VRASLGLGYNTTSVSRSIFLEASALSEEMESERSGLTGTFSVAFVKPDFLPLEFAGFKARYDLLLRLDHLLISSKELEETSESGTGDFVLGGEAAISNVTSGTLGVMGSMCFGRCEAPGARLVLLNYMLGFRFRGAHEDWPSLTFGSDETSSEDMSVTTSVPLGRTAGVFGFGIGVKPVAGLDLAVTFEGLGEVSDASCDIGGAFRVSGSF